MKATQRIRKLGGLIPPKPSKKAKEPTVGEEVKKPETKVKKVKKPAVKKVTKKATSKKKSAPKKEK